MKIDYITLGTDRDTTISQARRAEEVGYDGWFTGETGHDPFLMCGYAADATERVHIGTAIAVAFARNPMITAYSANDLHLNSGGRFVLGLGSQIKAHIERRFHMPWSSPAARMREFINAMRAIWRTWNEGDKLDFRGDFYEHTLMTPFFSPQPNPHGTPPIYLAAVGPLMTEVAGEVCDGVIAHSFTTERYLREHTLPALARGRERADTDRDAAVSLGVFTITGRDEQEVANNEAFVKGQIAFYGSTPAYRAVLETHGWEDLQSELNTLSKQGKWAEMSELITDDIVDAFAVRGAPTEVGSLIADRFGDVVDRISLYTAFQYEKDEFEDFAAGLRGEA
ncbi:MAG: LLM class F420-dependent oxidoreductase [Actinobacteria bacterium]|nr:LLM class F420-dependent oxidoreductase [Actinomycetota bacterium]